MDTRQIEALLLIDPSCREIFRGVMASDVFARLYRLMIRKGGDHLFIVNTDTSNKPGTHWLCIWRRDARTWFFDPFGGPAELYATVYPTIEKDKPVSNLISLQSTTSDVCGDYCVLYGLAVARDVSPLDFALYWKRRGEERDDDVRDIIRSLLTDVY